jgi:hypothetical protein
MDATRSHTAGPTKAALNKLEVVTTESALFGDLLKAGALSTKEIDKLIGDLQRARDYIKYEGERLQSQATRYAHLTRTALASVKAVSEGLNKWGEDASLHPNQATAADPN